MTVIGSGNEIMLCLHALDVDKNGAVDENLISAKGVWGDEAPPQT